MGNCFRKKQVNPGPESSGEVRVKNGGWKRRIAKRLGLAQYSARVDVINTDVDGSDVDNITVSEHSLKRSISDGSHDISSALVLFYAHADEGTDVDTVTPMATQSNLLARQSDSPYFSSEESLYDGFVNTGNEIEEDIPCEPNNEDNRVNTQEECKENPTVVDRIVEDTDQKRSSHKEASAGDIESIESPFSASKHLSSYSSLNEDRTHAEDDIAEEIPEEIPEGSLASEDDTEYPVTHDTGTGHVNIDKTAMQEAIKRIQELKSLSVDLLAPRKDTESETLILSKPKVLKKRKAVTGSSNRHSPTIVRDLTWTTNKSSLRSTKSEECRPPRVDEELKRKVSLTQAKSLEVIEEHQGKTDCMLDVLVRSANPDEEPKSVQVRATSQQVKDGAAKCFVKTLDRVTETPKFFSPLKKPKKEKSKQHLNKRSSLVASENLTVHWTQKSGTMSGVHLTSVPLFYEPSQKKKNAREKMGLERLQKYEIKIQCKEIERIKVNEELFPGILPPKLQEQLNKKKREKKHVN